MKSERFVSFSALAYEHWECLQMLAEIIMKIELNLDQVHAMNFQSHFSRKQSFVFSIFHSVLFTYNYHLPACTTSHMTPCTYIYIYTRKSNEHINYLLAKNKSSLFRVQGNRSPSRGRSLPEVRARPSRKKRRRERSAKVLSRSQGGGGVSPLLGRERSPVSRA